MTKIEFLPHCAFVVFLVPSSKQWDNSFRVDPNSQLQLQCTHIQYMDIAWRIRTYQIKFDAKTKRENLEWSEVWSLNFRANKGKGPISMF